MILVTGGLGVMGSTLVKGLADRGFKVRVLDNSDRFRSRLEGYDVDIRIGDITKPETLVGCFDGVETVYHLAAVLIVYDPSLFQKINVEGTRNIINASIQAGVKHFILVSSASVTYAHTTPYSLSKRETERLIKAQNAMNWTIVRPTLAYNESGGEEFNMFLAYLKKYPFVPFIGAGRSLKRPVHCDDLMKGFLGIAKIRRPTGKLTPSAAAKPFPSGRAKLMLKHVGQEALHYYSDSDHQTNPLRALSGKPILTWNAIAASCRTPT
jgi:NADH dehydrogenase